MRRALLTGLLAAAREKRITAKAASLAFYAFNVFVALFVLTYAAFTVFGTGTVLTRTLQILTGVGAGEFQRLFEEVSGTAAGRRRAIVLAVVISIWSSLRLFWAIESVFTEIYEVRKERSVLGRVVDSVLVLLSVTAIVVVMAAVGAAFVFRTADRLWIVLGPVVLWLSMLILFLPLYYRFSGADDSVAEILPGTAVAASGWTVSTIGLRVYVGVSESVDLYGVVGGLLLVLTWLYVVGLSIVLGVILNAFLAGRIDADRE